MTKVDEHRLALVLNGGISLAIWMGGVANELDLIRRASSPGADVPPMDDAEHDVFTLWQRACEGKPRVVVDVIAGTSAGGLNGVFLAAAIARNGTLRSLRKLWMERAQLDGKEDHLLDPSRTTVNSVLNGAAFLGSVVDALEKITPIGQEPGQEVTLVTTASAAGGPPRVFRDSQGTRFELPDHRRRYRFRSGPGGFVATTDASDAL
ncbi:MAG TPA: patatin-like phospholipase family protein, partial [Amnibacterium sp.]